MQHEHTVTVTDASSHTVTLTEIVAENKPAAIIAAIEQMQTQKQPLVGTDTWTVTVTQP